MSSDTSADTPADTASVIQSAWADQARWSGTADLLKQRISGWRRWTAVAGVAGVVCTTLAAQAWLTNDGAVPWKGLFWLLGSLLLALVPIVLKTTLSADKLDAWVRARAASEALKGAIYRFLLSAPPFAEGASATDFIKHCQETRQSVADLGPLAAQWKPPAAAADKPRPLTLSAADYVQKRVTQAVDSFYLPRAGEAATQASRLRLAEFLLSLLAAALGVLSNDGIQDVLPLMGNAAATVAPWVAVVTTAGGAVAAHLAAARHENLARVYYATAERLRGLRDLWQVSPTRQEPAEVATLVDAVENAITAENGSWVADWSKGG